MHTLMDGHTAPRYTAKPALRAQGILIALALNIAFWAIGLALVKAIF